MAIDTSYEGTKRELQTDRGVLRYHEAGDGPPLLFLHGSGPGVSGWRNFNGVLPHFAAHYRCLILEFPGYGVSDFVEGPPMMVVAQSVPRFLQGLGIDRAPIIGNSLGGIIGANIAMVAPQVVERLVTVGGIGPNVASPAPGEGIRLLSEFADNPTKENMVRWLRSMVFDPAVVTDQLIEERWKLASDPEAQKTAKLMYGAEALKRMSNPDPDTPPYWAGLGKIQCPTLITWGRHDRVSTMDMALVPLTLISNAELHVFPKCGHWSMIEAKAAFEATVLAFLQRPA